jgi:hypothetical protein
MRPKDKAQELIDKFKFVEIPNYSSMFEVKQCILISIDEIINAIRYTEANKDYGYVGYWNEVKQEIEKL